mmetsp:Transcript_64411/g.126723  ORF Transcript_64411/g.126723 Transcript_64411/m.126723 type:complete len:465 (+) Transcript_64411:10-1404(+)
MKISAKPLFLIVSASFGFFGARYVAHADDTDFRKKKVVIIGGGMAGIGVAAMLKQEGMKNVTIIEPSPSIYYQPLWTLVGAGLKKNVETVKPVADVVPSGTSLLPLSVSAIDPVNNTLFLSDKSVVSYDYLVVAAGIQMNWDKVSGLTDALKDKSSGVVSIYGYDLSAAAWEAFDAFKKGRLIFNMPSTPIKCAGAPQKIMWLVEEMLRDRNIRETASVEFWVPGGAMFGVKKYSDQLEIIRQQRNVDAQFKQELVSVDGNAKTAVFKSLENGSTSTQAFDILHVVPPMSAPDFLKASPLADAQGWVDVNKFTLQSKKYPNVFGLGDCTNTPNSKTGAAVTAQAPVVVHNLIQHSKDSDAKLTGQYNGYASCPLVIGKNKVILAEFGYDGKIMETFDATNGKFPYRLLSYTGPLKDYTLYWMKSTMFPFVFWHLWPRACWYGSCGPFKPNVVPAVDLEAPKVSK